MAEPTENQEPSMEEILASIRRIISEDGATVTPAPAEEGAAAEAAPILDLVAEVKDDGSVAEVAKAEEAAPAMDPIIDMEEIKFEPPPAPVPEPVVTAPVVVHLDEDALISETTAQASASVLSNLSKLKQGSNGVAISSFPLGDSSRTLEGMVLEIIRPQLKEWLDANLPTLVEKIVQKEIQKITRDLN